MSTDIQHASVDTKPTATLAFTAILDTLSFPEGGLKKPTGKDQRSWLFLNDPKNIVTDRKSPKILSLKQNSSVCLVNVKHDVIIMKICVY